MFNFFANENQLNNEKYFITGTDYNHIVNVLRMNQGDKLFVSFAGKSDLCKIESITNETVIAQIIEKDFQSTELPVKIYLFQGLPKSDKMELIIQKTTELGLTDIVPVEMNRCVVKIDEKKKSSKQTRWQAIAESAAKQSKRSFIPEIHQITSYKNALKKAQELDLILVPYENKNGMSATKDALKVIKPGMSIGLFIGPEGGFDENEIELALKSGGTIISLGKRILRTETAAITAVGMCMLHIEMNI